MFSQTILQGRLVKAPELHSKGTGCKEIMWAWYRLAVSREYSIPGQPGADFIPCVAFGKRAEFIAKYGQRGTLLLVSGRIETGSYINKEQIRIPTVQLRVERQELCANWRHHEEAPERMLAHNQDYPPREPEEDGDVYALPAI